MSNKVVYKITIWMRIKYFFKKHLLINEEVNFAMKEDTSKMLVLLLPSVKKTRAMQLALLNLLSNNKIKLSDCRYDLDTFLTVIYWANEVQKLIEDQKLVRFNDNGITFSDRVVSYTEYPSELYNYQIT